MDLHKINRLQEAKSAAETRHGLCLSEAYQNASSHLLWRCAEGHEWGASFGNVVTKGTWCRACRHENLRSGGLDRVRQHAKKHGGECLSLVYKNGRTPLTWRCSKGHTWNGAYDYMRTNNGWCSDCRGARVSASLRRHTIEDAEALALKRNGHCLSATYVNTKEHLLWECSEGHQWETSYHSVSGGTWCPECLYITELETRKFFESISLEEFPKRRGLFKYNRRFELDGFCEKYRIGFEYHGKQHYDYVPYFHKNGPSDLEERQRVDALKEELCVEEHIVLIVIPYWLSRIDRETYIRKELHLLGVLPQQ
jgi:hypothetical protein